MKKIKKILLLTVFGVILLSLLNKVNAASASISANSRTIEKGKSTTVSAYISSTETWQLSMSASGGSLSGNTNNADAYGEEKSLTALSGNFTANSTGTYTIYLSGYIAGSDLSKVNVNTSVTITVTEPVKNDPPVEEKDPATQKNDNKKPNTPTNTTKKPEVNKNVAETKKSADALLSSLKVQEGEIIPAFDPNVKEYILDIANNVSGVNIEAITNDSKASFSIEGETSNLQIGENIIKVIVIAEDGTANEYVIKINRGRPSLILQSLKIKYINKDGEEVEVKLDPEFSSTVLEYKLEDLEYWIEKLQIEAISNFENAKIEVEGADNLKEGENIITITLRIPVEKKTEISGEEATGEQLVEEEEVIVYKIIVNKEKAPTLWEKILGWFKDNQNKVIFGGLVISAFLLFILSIFIIADYGKYRKVLAKIAELNGLKTEEITESNEVPNILEEISEKLENDEEVTSKKAKGRH